MTTRSWAAQNIAHPTNVLNIAATCQSTRSLGPGVRAVVWVQGCPFHCPGCIAPDWLPIQPNHLVTPDDLLSHLLADPRVTGLTFSGGEPMLQAASLARLARLARAERPIDIICYTGFQRRQLIFDPPGPGVAELLDQVDVLIDGPYISRLNDNKGMRGSSNQTIHYLTNRIRPHQMEDLPRRAEIVMQDGYAMLIGVPPAKLGDAYNQAIDRANSLEVRLLSYERI